MLLFSVRLAAQQDVSFYLRWAKHLSLTPRSYRLRLINTGSTAQLRFSVDNHPLTIIEADGTLVEPYTVTGLTLIVAQRYSVLLTTNQTAGAYWMRMNLTVLQDVAGTNNEVFGVIRCVSSIRPLFNILMQTNSGTERRTTAFLQSAPIRVYLAQA